MATLNTAGVPTLQLVLLSLLLLWLPWKAWRLCRREKPAPSQQSIAILVLGDIGRSPRMMYHAESFANNQFETFFIGYRGSKVIPSLVSHPNVRFLYLSEPPAFLSIFPFILAASVKVMHQSMLILDALLVRVVHPPEYIIVQNPPSIPTLGLIRLVGWLRGSKVIIDWHNLGYTLLAMKLGNNHPFVRIAKAFEALFGKTAFAHLFVTQAMHDYLVTEWALEGRKAVLHDRPPSHFHHASPLETHELFLRLYDSFSPPLRDFFPASSSPYSTPFTKITKANEPALRSDRPALLVSSTSWTPDEDFSILIEALGIYQRRATEVNRTASDETVGVKLPKVLMLITGKGPLKAKYMKEVDALQNGCRKWEWVRLVSLWLEAEDYPLLLGSADLGICLHSSSSKLDLPMKVVDMFGCGLPVCALNFPCLGELIKDGKNGLVFDNAQQLADNIEALLTSFPNSQSLTALQSSFTRCSSRPLGSPRVRNLDLEEKHWEWNTWEDNWNAVVRPLVLKAESSYDTERM